jgi:PAS domain-containing protein
LSGAVAVVPVFDEEGKCTHLVGSVHDITERIQAEKALLESRARLAGIIESAMDAIITVDDEQRIVLFNQAAEVMFRCSAGELTGELLERFIPPRFHQAHREHIKTFGLTGVTSRRMGALGGISGCAPTVKNLSKRRSHRLRPVDSISRSFATSPGKRAKMKSILNAESLKRG